MKQVDEMEQMTLDFLRKHDTLFLKKNKKKLMDYPYLSEKQVRTREGKEIPISSLSSRQKQMAVRLGDSIDWNTRTKAVDR